MLDIVHFPLFFVSALLLLITPGPDLAYVVGQSVANGRRSGVISAVGVALGSCAHALASALGITALIAASPLLFSVVKYLGAAYLIWLGLSMIISSWRRQTAVNSIVAEKISLSDKSLLLKGFITTITNPKVLLFFIAFFPQFVAVTGEHQALSFFVLGMVYAATGLLVDASFAWMSGSLSARVSTSQRLRNWLDRAVGATFIALGIRLMFTRR
ncbi:LysE family translocator [Entomohabitans teleogrylli]|uniref:LysE family translocator n=1 Tax=Entomohabitans teleogrylli TaxID=1384589 RepID=UPI00073D3F14|nr:LysE family translocator [Entomohabitans teleogrylli]